MILPLETGWLLQGDPSVLARYHGVEFGIFVNGQAKRF